MVDYRQLIEILKGKKMTISTAESCTGGLIAKLITDIPGSSEVFVGGMVSYSDEMKRKWLGVRKSTLAKYGAVSEATIKEMLDGILKNSGSDIAVAVSGIAGPTGGTPEKLVGTVFIGVSVCDQQIIKRYHFEGSRDQVRMDSAMAALKMIVNKIGVPLNNYL